MWAIYSVEEPDLAWSNDQGWVSGPEFDLFTDEERQTLDLPVGGEWRQVTFEEEA